MRIIVDQAVRSYFHYATVAIATMIRRRVGLLRVIRSECSGGLNSKGLDMGMPTGLIEDAGLSGGDQRAIGLTARHQ